MGRAAPDGNTPDRLKAKAGSTQTARVAEASFSVIVGLLLKGHRVIHIHRSLSHGLELFTDDG